MAAQTEAPVTGRNSAVRTLALVLAICLCTASCALMFMLDPKSLAVDSVYQGF